MYNKVILVGRISTDLELRQTSNEKVYCKFNLAVSRMNGGTDFISVTIWNKQAENLIQYQTKGSLILVDGSISTGSYTDKNGNKKSTFDVVAQNIQFLGSKNISSNEEELSVEDSQIDDVYEDFGEQLDIDDNFLD